MNKYKTLKMFLVKMSHNRLWLNIQHAQVAQASDKCIWQWILLGISNASGEEKKKKRQNYCSVRPNYFMSILEIQMPPVNDLNLLHCLYSSTTDESNAVFSSSSLAQITPISFINVTVPSLVLSTAIPFLLKEDDVWPSPFPKVGCVVDISGEYVALSVSVVFFFFFRKVSLLGKY